MGGKVHGINVNEDFGGVTRTSGGWRVCILPAGYIGSTLWGGMFLILCYDNTATFIGASLMILAAVVTAIVLQGSRVMFMRISCVCVAVMVGFVWWIQETALDDSDVHPLRWLLTMLGTVCVCHALY